MLPTIRRVTRFLQHNLLTPLPHGMGPFHVILCRNVLLYLRPEAIQTAVQSDRYGDYLDARRAEAEELMINGIPAHVIADRYLIMGAQAYEVFERVMARLDVRRRNAVAP